MIRYHQLSGDFAAENSNHITVGTGSQELQRLPSETIVQSITPDDSQRGKLEHLRVDAGKQEEVLRAACPRDIPADPLAQLDVSKSSAEAVLAAVNTVAPLVEDFYATLRTNRRPALWP